jgi:hypothetical protein
MASSQSIISKKCFNRCHVGPITIQTMRRKAELISSMPSMRRRAALVAFPGRRMHSKRLTMRESSTYSEISVSCFLGQCSTEAQVPTLTIATGAIVKEARARAGPEDAKLMVGKDFGGLTVVN